MPRRVINFVSPCRVTPSSAAARPRWPPVRTSAARTNRSSNVRRASSSRHASPAPDRRTAAAAPSAARRRASRRAPRATPARSAARARCPASRSAPAPPASRRRAWRGCRRARAASRQKCSASSAMSSRRSRSGGTAMRTTSSRYSRSSRNRPAATSCRRSRLVADTMRTSTRREDVLTDAPQLALLNDAQHLGLRARRQLADLVEQQRAAVRLLEHARALGDRAGERAAGVAEQLGLDQVVGQRRAVERAERAFCRRGSAWMRARHQLLAAAALAFDQHRKRRRRRALDARRTSAIAALTPSSSTGSGPAAVGCASATPPASAPPPRRPSSTTRPPREIVVGRCRCSSARTARQSRAPPYRIGAAASIRSSTRCGAMVTPAAIARAAIAESMRPPSAAIPVCTPPASTTNAAATACSCARTAPAHFGQHRPLVVGGLTDVQDVDDRGRTIGSSRAMAQRRRQPCSHTERQRPQPGRAHDEPRHRRSRSAAGKTVAQQVASRADDRRQPWIRSGSPAQRRERGRMACPARLSASARISRAARAEQGCVQARARDGASPPSRSTAAGRTQPDARTQRVRGNRHSRAIAGPRAPINASYPATRASRSPATDRDARRRDRREAAESPSDGRASHAVSRRLPRSEPRQKSVRASTPSDAGRGRAADPAAPQCAPSRRRVGLVETRRLDPAVAAEHSEVDQRRLVARADGVIAGVHSIIACASRARPRCSKAWRAPDCPGPASPTRCGAPARRSPDAAHGRQRMSALVEHLRSRAPSSGAAPPARRRRPRARRPARARRVHRAASPRHRTRRAARRTRGSAAHGRRSRVAPRRQHPRSSCA